MAGASKIKDEESANLLLYVPQKDIKFETDPDTNQIILKKPKFSNRFLIEHLMPKLQNPEFSIKLDEYGSHVWQAIDGKRNVQQIAEHLKAQFGGTVEPVYERVGKFIISLEKNKFIVYKS